MPQKTAQQTRFMPYVALIPVGKIVTTCSWSFSCDLSMKNVLKFCLVLLSGKGGGASLWYCLALQPNVDLSTLWEMCQPC
jgi:hypothetical protein